ncbi:MAG: FAD/NAD(P)-binding oxidoreductase, partial [Anaerolineae bacterium]
GVLENAIVVVLSDHGEARARTERPMADVMPRGAKWHRGAVAGFEPREHAVVLEDGERIGYRVLVVAPGIKLNWQAVDGLLDTLGRNGVTSNYMFDMAPYTWELVQSLRGGRAVFTQPPMPIKCAGAPQKAMYLSCDHWLRQGRLNDIDVAFHNAGGVLFGVPDYVPALERYVEKYGARVNFNENLKAVDGSAQRAWFDVTEGEKVTRKEVEFDMLHVCPPQCAPDFVRSSPLADEAGWMKVSPETMAHPDYGNVFGLGDACSAPNAKTAAAVRKQAPVVAENVLAVLNGRAPRAVYDGYGSCP